MKRKHIGIIFLSVFLALLFVSFGCAALKTNFQISGEAYVRIEDDIRITDLKVISMQNGAYETYNSKYSKNTTSMFTTLPNSNSSITYEVTVTNKTGAMVQVDDIVSKINSNQNVAYTITGLQKNYTVFNSSTVKFQIKFTNKSSTSQVASHSIEYKFSLYTYPKAPIIKGGSDTWTNQTRTITIGTSGTAYSGVKHYEYYLSLTNNKPSDSVTVSGTTSGNLTVSKNGTTYVFYRTVAKNGYKSQWSSYQVVKIDTNTCTAPTITGGSTSWTKDSRTISLQTASICGDSGLKNYQYYISTSGTNTTGGTWTDGSSVKINTDGVKYVFLRAVSKSGQAGSLSKPQTVKVDKTAPSCGTWSGGSTSWTKGNRTISLTCNDNSGSGCVKNTYSQTYSTDTKTTTTSFNISDNVGNTRTCSSTQNVYVDKTVPTLVYSNYGTSADICTTDNSASVNSGVNSFYTGYTTGTYNSYSSIPNSAWLAWGYRNVVNNTGTIDVYANGNYWCYRWDGVGSGTLGASVCDNAGNCTDKVYNR